MALRGLSTTPRAVLLDALGTLVSLEPPAPRLRSELALRFGLAVTPAQAEQAIAAEIVYYRAHLLEGRDDAGVERLRASCAGVLSRELERALDRRVPTGPEMIEALLASLQFAAFSDARPTLEELHRLGLRLVVVSNWDVSLGDVLARLGLTAWLGGVVTSAAVGAAKPDKAIFDRGLAAAGVGASQAIHVGDSVREDVEGARAAGIKGVLVSRDELTAPDPRPEFVTVRTLLELPALVSKGNG